jgi:hypothetical protein
MMKNLKSILVLAFAGLLCVSLSAQQPEKKQSEKKQATAGKKGPGTRTSPHETVFARVGPSRTLVSITYGRPFTQKGGKATEEVRQIWGKLVPWDKADRLGSDEATTITLQHPIQIGETTIPAGVHALYIIPSESGTSKLAFSKNVAKWGIPVDEKSDIARVDLKKETLDQPVNQLTIAVENEPPTDGVIKIMWEKTQYSVAFTPKP